MSRLMTDTKPLDILKGITVKVEVPAELKESALKMAWYDGARTGLIAGLFLVVLLALFWRKQ